MDVEAVLKGVLPAIGTALLLVSLAGVRLLPLAAALGLFACYVLLKQWPALPTALWSSPNGVEWLLWAVAAAALLALLEHAGMHGRLAAILAPAVAGVAVWLVLEKVARNWSTGEVVGHVGAGGLALMLLTLGHRSLVRTAPPGLGTAILLTVVLSADAGLLTLGGSAMLGQLCGACAAATGAAAGTVLWRQPFALAPADGTWLGIAHGLFLLAGMHLSALPWQAALLAAASPMLPLLLSKNLKGRPFVWAVAAAALVGSPLALAFWFASR